MMRLQLRELRDFSIAWILLALAFTLFILSDMAGGGPLGYGPLLASGIVQTVFGGALVSVGVAFLVHELAHKLVAVHYDQIAEFRANYRMLALAVGAGLAGVLFAAPGAVHHRGYLTPRENALIALAGPLSNVGLAGVFLPLLLLEGFLGDVGQLGVTFNAALAGFNMIPFGPLDGKQVRAWSTRWFGLSFLLCAGLAVLALVSVGLPY
jgi:Zn-dependent protease